MHGSGDRYRRVARICIVLALFVATASSSVAAIKVASNTRVTGWVYVTELAKVKAEFSVHVPRHDVIVSTSFSGMFFAVEDRYLVQGVFDRVEPCPMSLFLESPRTGAKFDRAGRVKISGPLTPALRSYPIEVRRGKVYVDVRNPRANEYADAPLMEKAGPYCL